MKGLLLLLLLLEGPKDLQEDLVQLVVLLHHEGCYWNAEWNVRQAQMALYLLKDGSVMNMASSAWAIISAKVAWAVANEADVAEKVRTASIIAKKSLGVIWMNPIGGAGVLGPAASEGPTVSEGPTAPEGPAASEGPAATDGE